MKRYGKYVAASELGVAAKCPSALAHKYCGSKVSYESQQRMSAGNEAHDQFNQQLKADTQDPRCFVASMLYGQNAIETNLLREFRDRNLMTSRLGRLIVSFYYRYSPKLVAISLCHPCVQKLAYFAVSPIVHLLKQRIKD